jgi:thioredoxin reductase (NADPH)
MERVKVYGADWCALTRRTLTHLDRLGVAYDYIDVDYDRDASEWVMRQNNGKEKKPTLDINGRVLTAPTHKQLEDALRTEHVLA